MEPEIRLSRLGLLIFFLAATGVLAALALLLIWPRVPSKASLELDRKFALLRKDRVPLTAMELGRAIPDPDAEHDARLILQQAFAWSPRAAPSTNIPIVGGGPFPNRTNSISSPAMRDLVNYLTNSDTLLSAIPTNLDGVWFSMGWTNGFTNMPTIPLVQVRQIAQALAVKSFSDAEIGEHGKAVHSLRAGLAVAGTLNGDSLVSTMIRVAVLGLMCDATEQVLNRAIPEENELFALQKSIKPALADNFTNAYMVERYMNVTAFDPLRAVYEKGGAERAKLTLWSWIQWFQGHRKPVYRDEDYLLSLNTLDERRATQSLSGLERLKRSNDLDAQYKTNSYSMMADYLGTHWTKALRAAIETRAKLETARTAVAVERWRRAHGGALPETLANLVPEYLPDLPRDPFDNRSLRFKKLGRGYVVYSISADGVDDGGAERMDSNTNANYDVTFTVER